MDAASAVTSQKFPSGIKRQPGSNGYVSKYSALWACLVTVEDQNGKEEGNEEWGKNWEMSKHAKENKGKCRRERGGEMQKTERILAFLTAHEMCGRMSNVPWYGNAGA